MDTSELVTNTYSIWTDSIFINIVSAILWALIGVIAFRVYGVIKKRLSTPFNHLTKFYPGLSRVHLIYGLIDLDEIRNKSFIEEGDVSALCAGLLLLENVFGTKKVEVINYKAALLHFGSYENVLCISGPVWNPISKVILEKLDAPVKFETEDSEDVLVFSTKNDNKRFKTKIVDGIEREDYGILVSGKLNTIENDKGQNATVFAGISSLATFGAMIWLKSISNGNISKEQTKIFKKNKGTVLILLKVQDKSPNGFKAYTANQNNPGFLNVEIETIMTDKEF